MTPGPLAQAQPQWAAGSRGGRGAAGELPAQCRRLVTPRAGRKSARPGEVMPDRTRKQHPEAAACAETTGDPPEARSGIKPPSAPHDGGGKGCSYSSHGFPPVPRASAFRLTFPAAQDLGRGLHGSPREVGSETLKGLPSAGGQEVAGCRKVGLWGEGSSSSVPVPTSWGSTRLKSKLSKDLEIQKHRRKKGFQSLLEAQEIWSLG